MIRYTVEGKWSGRREDLLAGGDSWGGKGRRCTVSLRAARNDSERGFVRRVGEHCEVISNVLFLPRNEDIAKYHWPIFSDDPPEKPDVRTVWFTAFGVEG